MWVFKRMKIMQLSLVAAESLSSVSLPDLFGKAEKVLKWQCAFRRILCGFAHLSAVISWQVQVLCLLPEDLITDLDLP